MKYLCIIGDIIRSREIERRRAFQENLKRTLSKLVTRRPDILSPYTLTLGDEFQAVYRTANQLFEDFVRIQIAIFPAQARFSIGVGQLRTQLNRVRALEMDGPAFYAARDAINSMKKSSGNLLRVQGLDRPEQQWINSALDLISHAVADWKLNRLRILHELLCGHDVGGIAKSVGVSPAAVYKSIRAGALYDVVALMHHIAASINGELSRR